MPYQKEYVISDFNFQWKRTQTLTTKKMNSSPGGKKQTNQEQLLHPLCNSSSIINNNHEYLLLAESIMGAALKILQLECHIASRQLGPSSDTVIFIFTTKEL